MLAFSSSSHKCLLRTPPRTPVCSSFTASLLTSITAVLKCTPKRGIKITRSQKSKAALKARRVRSPNKHSHKLNTSNLEAHSLTKYHYTVQGNFFTYSSHVVLPISPPSISFWSGFEPGSSVTNCNWVVTRRQWLLYMYTKYEIGY